MYVLTGGCIYFESESALTSEMLKERGIDTKRVYHMPVATVEEFRHQAVKILEKHGEMDESDRPPLMMCLDSLGMLSTVKEMTDISEDNLKRDMTKAQLIKGAFRMLTLKMGQAKIPFIVTNHVYDSMSLYEAKKMGGGSGLFYASSSVIFLSKSKEKEGTSIVGNLIKAKTIKSRLSKENKDVTIRLFYDRRGLDKYYGLLELGELAGMWKNVAGRYEMTVNGETKKVYAKAILKDPELYFTEEVMQQLDAAANKEFSYGTD
mgnify:CR=1 FL=1